MENTKCRWGTLFNTFEQSHWPNSTTLLAWQDGQKWRRLDEKARRYSWLQALHLTLANPL